MEAYAYATVVFSTRFVDGPCPCNLKMRPHLHSPSTNEAIDLLLANGENVSASPGFESLGLRLRVNNKRQKLNE